MLDFFFFFFAACFGSEAIDLGIFVGSGTSPKSFSISFRSDTWHLSASLSAQGNSVLSFCDSPVVVSIITSTVLMPTLSCSIYHVKDRPPQSTHKSTAHHKNLKGRLGASLKNIFFAFWGVANTSFVTSKFPELWFFNYQSNIYLQFLNICWIFHEYRNLLNL